MTSSISRRKRRKLKSEINVVPYIDVMLVLLIIFISRHLLMSHKVKVELARGQP
ncbi:protein TolR, partial [Xanthomonas sp. Kuri4-2]